jgi:molybdopterin molybdotransferase
MMNKMDETKNIPKDYQIRVSNSLMIQAALANINITSKVFMCKDNPEKLTTLLANSLKKYELIIITGAVSMGKSDYIPAILNKLAVKNLFHGVQQRPAKPLWFGKSKQGNVVFAMPGNPVSAAVCTYVYLLPWLKKLGTNNHTINYAKLTEEVIFKPELTYYLQVKISNNNQGELLATPITGNGSGDLTNLTKIDAFMELPSNKTTFSKDEVYPIFYIR